MSQKFNTNLEHKVILDFGHEWNYLNQSTINNKKLNNAFNQYFKIFYYANGIDTKPGRNYNRISLIKNELSMNR